MVDYFARPTYILFDLPEKVTELVNGIRRKFDPERSKMNAEVSIAGSSGVGTVVAGQSPQKVFAEVRRIAEKLRVFRTGFKAVGSFPGTGIYFFTMTEEKIFREIHKLFREADIRYNSSLYAYSPHCTLTLFGEPLPEETAKELMALPVPAEYFDIDNISVYNIDDYGLNPELLFRVELKI